MSNSNETAPVELLTAHCRYRGGLVSRGYRITDVLNEATTAVVEMRDASVGVLRPEEDPSGNRPRSLRCSQLWLRKVDLLLAIPRGPHEAPARRAIHYQAKNQYPALVALGGTLLSGILHLSRPLVPTLLLAGNSPLPPFIAMTDVTVHAGKETLGERHYDVVIVRREAVEAAHVAQQPVVKSADADAAQSSGAQL